MRTLWLSTLGVCVSALAQVVNTPPTPPLPSDLPASVERRTVTPQVVPAPTTAVRPRNPNLPFQRATGQPQVNTRPQSQAVQPLPSPKPAYTGEEVLQFDAMTKEYNAKPGELTAHLEYAVTNISKVDVTVNWVRPSCGCTVPKLPPMPWKMAPGEGGVIALDVDLRGKFGTLAKYVSVDTSHGQKMLNLRVNIPTQNGAANPGVDRRTINMQIAMGDRQAVFKNDCASCHVTPAVGRKGEQLFSAACGICHEAPHRATMVPDLKALKVTPNKEYWTHWIRNGKPGSLMPAFAKGQGGPLSDEQIDSLVDYLTNYYPPRAVVATAATPSAED